jgi:hypothetical protein
MFKTAILGKEQFLADPFEWGLKPQRMGNFSNELLGYHAAIAWLLVKVLSKFDPFPFIPTGNLQGYFYRYNIYIYIPTYDLCIHDCLGVVRSSFMDWVLQAPRILDSLSTSSWLFSCPAHCSGNLLSSLVAGIGIGLCLGLLTGFWVLLSLQRLGCGLGFVAPQPEGLQHPRHSSSSSAPSRPHSDLPSPSNPEKRRSRVAGYLVHE